MMLARRSSVVLGDAFGMESGTQQVERRNGVAGVGIGLLFDDVPPVADAERRRSDAEPPRQMQPPADRHTASTWVFLNRSNQKLGS